MLGMVPESMVDSVKVIGGQREFASCGPPEAVFRPLQGMRHHWGLAGVSHLREMRLELVADAG